MRQDNNNISYKKFVRSHPLYYYRRYKETAFRFLLVLMLFYFLTRCLIL